MTSDSATLTKGIRKIDSTLTTPDAANYKGLEFPIMNICIDCT